MLFLIAAGCWLNVRASNPDPFTRIQSGPIAINVATSTGLAWIDYDNDGKLDLFVSVSGSGNVLYRNTGTAFVPLITGPLATNYSTSLSGVWGDYNNDGLPDLFVANLDVEQNLIYRNQGGGVFVREDGPPFAQDNTRSVSGAWADFDNDGQLDLFIANSLTNQANYLYRNAGDGTFSRVLNQVVATEVVRSPCASWSDYDNDGDLDLVVTSEGGTQNRLYRNDGKGQFTKITGSPIAQEGGFSAGCAWGDYNNDGFQDLFIANLHGADNFLYRNNGNGTFSKVTTGVVVSDGGYSAGCAWGDYDNDGWLDLFVTNYQGEKNALYHNNRDGTFTRITTSTVATTVGSSRGCAWGDYDGDGFLDLAVSNDSGHPLFLFHNNGNTNHRLKVRCAGTHSNRSAIGAKVRVQAQIGGANVWQLREVSGGTGYGSQNELATHFGLGDATNALTLRIEWPSGIVQEFRDVAANQTLTINEPPLLSGATVRAAGAFEFTLTSRNGLSYRVDSSTNLSDWTGLRTLVNVNGAVQVSDTRQSVPKRFYRAVQVP